MTPINTMNYVSIDNTNILVSLLIFNNSKNSIGPMSHFFLEFIIGIKIHSSFHIKIKKIIFFYTKTFLIDTNQIPEVSILVTIQFDKRL
jgi:hypothetical protein